MVSAEEIGVFAGLPLLAGLAVTATLRWLRVPMAVPSGCWLVVTLVYWLRLALDEAAAGGQFLLTAEERLDHVSAAAQSLLFPAVAIQWVPWVVGVLLVVGWGAFWAKVVGAHFFTMAESDRPSSLVDQPPQGGRFVILGLTLLAGSVFAAAIVRMLWTSIYFSEEAKVLSQIGMVGLPALVLGISSACFALVPPNRAARVTKHVLIVVLAASGCGILATSGTLRYALLGASGVVAAVLASLFTRRLEAWLDYTGVMLAAAIGLPLILGYFFAEVTWWSLLLVGLSAVGTAVFQRCRLVSWPVVVVVGLVVAIPVLAALTTCGYHFYREVSAEPAYSIDDF